MVVKKAMLSGLILGFFLPLSAQKISREQYIKIYKDIAISEMKRSGVPASITLAQGMLESDNGNSTLATKANNHFGIKCHRDWTGRTYTHDDDRPNECFRRYRNAKESFRDHSDFLTKHNRYAFLFELEITDYKNWAKGLKKAGYATNRQYDKLLITIIEANGLYVFDSKKYKQPHPSNVDIIAETPKERLSNQEEENVINPFNNNVRTYNRIDYVIADEGDTYESIADNHELRAWQLYKYNEVEEGTEIIPGQRVYLQPKRRKAHVSDKYHTVKPGETMYTVSQQYGIKLKHLYRINRMEKGEEAEVGDSLSLRKKVKKEG